MTTQTLTVPVDHLDYTDGFRFSGRIPTDRAFFVRVPDEFGYISYVQYQGPDTGFTGDANTIDIWFWPENDSIQMIDNENTSFVFSYQGHSIRVIPDDKTSPYTFTPPNLPAWHAWVARLPQSGSYEIQLTMSNEDLFSREFAFDVSRIPGSATAWVWAGVSNDSDDQEIDPDLVAGETATINYVRSRPAQFSINLVNNTDRLSTEVEASWFLDILDDGNDRLAFLRLDEGVSWANGVYTFTTDSVVAGGMETVNTYLRDGGDGTTLRLALIEPTTVYSGLGIPASPAIGQLGADGIIPAIKQTGLGAPAAPSVGQVSADIVVTKVGLGAASGPSIAQLAADQIITHAGLGIAAGPAAGQIGGTVVQPYADAPINLRQTGTTQTGVVVTWDAPEDPFSAPVTSYEYRLDGRAFVSTESPAPVLRIEGLRIETSYVLEIRPINRIGAGPLSEPFRITTGRATAPEEPVNLQATPASATAVDLRWEAPRFDGGTVVTHYQICVIDDSGAPSPYEDTDGPDLTWRVRGLAKGHRYSFRARAVNIRGISRESFPAEATPRQTATTVIPAGQRIPLIDADRQTLILRLANQDCLLAVWWQPSDASWWASIEVPTNTPAVTSRRLALDAGLLDRVRDVLPGNLVMRELGDAGLEPGRDAWQRPTHALMWEQGLTP